MPALLAVYLLLSPPDHFENIRSNCLWRNARKRDFEDIVPHILDQKTFQKVILTIELKEMEVPICAA